jgi:hypothetical protein
LSAVLEWFFASCQTCRRVCLGLNRLSASEASDEWQEMARAERDATRYVTGTVTCVGMDSLIRQVAQQACT